MKELNGKQGPPTSEADKKTLLELNWEKLTKLSDFDSISELELISNI